MKLLIFNNNNPMKKTFIVLCTAFLNYFLVVPIVLFANGEGDTVKEETLDQEFLKKKYIEDYKYIAVEEMHRSGIPASITIAQGLVESGFGKSRLAVEGNNHFGIKCKALWVGPVIYEDDDAKQECFRKYETVHASYRDHSDFLMDGDRYKFLFDLPQGDYIGWAQGLKKAGYATNPKYSEKLIELIEKYTLHTLDNLNEAQLAMIKKEAGFANENSDIIINAEPILAEEQIHDTKTQPVDVLKTSETTTFTEYKPGETITYNGLRAVIADYSDSYLKLSHKHGLTLWKFYEFNDLTRGSRIKEGEILYLQPKKNRSKNVEFHVVATGESMNQISQMHGIKLLSLYKLNRMKPGTEPLAGETISLGTKIEKDQIIKLQKEEIQEPFANTTPSNNSKADFSYKEKKNFKEISSKFMLHTVKEGDTMYSIASLYGILVTDLKKLNDKEYDYLDVGEVLKVGNKKQ